MSQYEYTHTHACLYIYIQVTKINTIWTFDTEFPTIFNMCCVYTNMYIFSQSQLHHSKIMPKFKKLQKRKVKLYQNGVVVHSSVIDLANVGNESASLPPTEFLDPPHASSTDLSSSMSEAPDPGHQPSSSVLLDISKCSMFTNDFYILYLSERFRRKETILKIFILKILLS